MGASQGEANQGGVKLKHNNARNTDRQRETSSDELAETDEARMRELERRLGDTGIVSFFSRAGTAAAALSGR